MLVSLNQDTDPLLPGTGTPIVYPGAAKKCRATVPSMYVPDGFAGPVTGPKLILGSMRRGCGKFSFASAVFANCFCASQDVSLVLCQCNCVVVLVVTVVLV
jgi:hypothetical protein